MKYIKLSDICDLQNGYAFKSTDYVNKSNTMNCRMSNIRPGAIFDIEYSPKYLPDNFVEKYSNYLLKDGDIVIAMTDLAGDPKILGVPAQVVTNGKNVLLNQRVGKLILKNNDIDFGYLKYNLSNQKNKEYYKKFSGGGLQINISKKDILNLQIPLHEKEEQIKISRKLDYIKDLINIRKKEINKLDNIIKSQFVEMFGDPFFNQKGYPIVKLGDISNLIKGITYSPSDVVKENGIIVLRSSNIKETKFDLEDIVRINKEISADKLVKENDILMCNRNGSARLVGKVAKIPKKSFDMSFGTFMTIIRSELFEYLFAFFQTEYFRKQIQFQTAVAINQISMPLLASVKIPLPPKEEIDKFTLIMKQIDKQKFVNLKIFQLLGKK